jgi:spoIIIJ-associated protein
MEWVETTGRTVAEALDVALDELGVDEDDVEYEVLTEPRGGFLGRLAGGEARVRARVKPLSREKPGDRRRARRTGVRGRNAASTEGGTPEPPGATASVATVGSESTTGAGERTGRPRRRRGGGGGRSGSNDVTAKGQDQMDEAGADHDDVPIEEQAAVALEFTRGLVDAFALGATVSSQIDDERVLIEVSGPSLGLLVGPHGATINAMEELVRTVVQHQTDGRGARLQIDVGGYRAKRRDALAEFTRTLAAKVLETGKPLALDPMPAPDRKVVHDVAAEIDGIASESEGEEPRRRVILRRA